MKKLIFAGLLSLLFPRQTDAQSPDLLADPAITFQEVSYSPEATQFTLFAPNDAKRVTLRIYHPSADCWSATIFPT